MADTVAVVTGATGGMGLAVAKRLAFTHNLVLADVNAQKLGQLAGELPGEARTVAGDLAEPETVAAVAAAVGVGPLGPVVHAAGLSPTMADAQRILEVNLAGTARLSAALLPHCRPGTVFLVVASQAGHTPNFAKLEPLLANPLGEGVLEQVAEALNGSAPAAYAASKYGVICLVVREAPRWGERGGRTVSVSPGLIDTAMGRAELESSPPLQRAVDALPVPRLGSVEEIADAVEFLVSSRATFITGTDLLIDGGSLAAQATQPEIAALFRP